MPKKNTIATILFFGLIIFQGSFAQELKSSSTLTAPELCSCIPDNVEEIAAIVPSCLFCRATPKSPEEMISTDLEACACLDKTKRLLADAPPSAEQRNSPSYQKNLLKEKYGTGTIASVLNYTKDKRNAEIALLVYSGAESRKKDFPADGPQVSSKLAEIDEIADNDSESNCVTYQEYSLQRDVPADNAFFQLLLEAIFKPEDWDIGQLRERFAAASEIEQKNIALKIFYLSRNPVLRFIFKARPSEVANAEVLNQKKTELYSILRNLAPAENSPCIRSSMGCWKEALSNGSFTAYQEKLGAFFEDPLVHDIQSQQSQNDYQAEMARLDKETSGSHQFTTPQAYFDHIQSAKPELVRSCSGALAKSECYPMFKDHCQSILAIHQRIKKGLKLNLTDIEDMAEQELAVHNALDPSANASYESFNDQICRQSFANATGERLNFFQYRKKVCELSSPPQECKNRKALLANFLTQYNLGSNPADMNLRAGFGQIMKNANFSKVSSQQIAAANQVTGSPKSIRSRFDGYPVITPQGTLAPAPRTLSSNKNSASRQPASNSEITESIAPTPNASNFKGSSSQVNFSSDTFPQKQQIKREMPITRPDAGQEVFSKDNNAQEFFPKVERSPAQAQLPASEHTESHVVHSDQSSDEEVIQSPQAAPFQGATPDTGFQVNRNQALSNTASTSSNEGSAALVPSKVARKQGAVSKNKQINGALQDKYVFPQKPIEILEDDNDIGRKVSIAVSLEQLRKSIFDPQALRDNTDLMEEIAAISEHEFVLELSNPGSDVTKLIHVTKDKSGKINLNEIPKPSLGITNSAKERTLRLKVDASKYGFIRENPNALQSDEAVYTQTANHSGRILRLQVQSAGKEPYLIFVDKRTPGEMNFIAEPLAGEKAASFENIKKHFFELGKAQK